MEGGGGLLAGNTAISAKLSWSWDKFFKNYCVKKKSNINSAVLFAMCALYYVCYLLCALFAMCNVHFVLYALCALWLCAMCAVVAMFVLYALCLLCAQCLQCM